MRGPGCGSWARVRWGSEWDLGPGTETGLEPLWTQVSKRQGALCES